MRESRRSIGMLECRQVTSRWEDDTVKRQYGHRWRGCQGRRGLTPLKDIGWQEERAGRVTNSYVTISNGD